MSRTPEERLRVRLKWLRAVQFSPIVAAALLAFVWFSLPAGLAATAFEAASMRDLAKTRPDLIGELSPERMVDRHLARRTLDDMDLGADEEDLPARVQDIWEQLTARRAEESSTAVTDLVRPEDPLLAPLADWERRHGGPVWAWAVESASSPSLVASATPSGPATQALVDAMRQNPLPRGDDVVFFSDPARFAFETLATLHADESRFVDPRRLGPGRGNSYRSDPLLMEDRTVVVDRRLWRYVLVSADGGDSLPGLPEELAAAEPGTDRHRRLLDAFARRHGLNVYVFGPLDYRFVPLRVPPGRTDQDAESLAAVMWPQATTDPLDRPDARLTPEQSRIAGGDAGVITYAGVFSSPERDLYVQGAADVAPTIAVLAVWDATRTTPGVLASAWRSWQRIDAIYLPWLLGVSFALLGLSLIAAPLAFYAERRLRTQERLRQHLERVQRDAHDRVYNRLTALARQLSLVALETPVERGGDLGHVADDIRTTVGELQQILGAEITHADTTLTTVTLGSQVSTVCRAQAARLGVAVRCDIADPLPEAPPELGWDLQCITEEAITNAVRHGGATRIEVRLEPRTGPALWLSVSDNGSGTTVTSPDQAPQSSTGLRSMSERVARWDGSVRLTGSEDGTELVAVLRLPPPV